MNCEGLKLKDLLVQRRSVILSKWFNRIIEMYPSDTVNFLKKEKDRFANPVGFTISQEIEALFQDLLKGTDAIAKSTSLGNIIRIMAVQDFSASKGISFVFSLKQVIKEELNHEINSVQAFEELWEFESEIDCLCLAAFDEYMKCRERIYEIKANQVTHRTYKLLERANSICENPDESEMAGAGCENLLNLNGGNGR
ncbi:MAG: hypothetical protein C4527_28445 [Candidatus Omnitrophota bacterium]|jgi:hypothetical protein|nr:MAG: hypothetical protein C4527_28445 [Candidatus Omnitrophota bacterium]